jgi:NAD(P)-dependent dehydrogenase (short-subunit alcohol dehydrogenase family)
MTGMLERFRLDGKAAVITGASSGLGRAFAQALAEAGADVALGARREQQLAETVSLVERTGRRAIAVRTDVTQPNECEQLAQRAYEEYGRLDILVNNAGVGSVIPALKETQDQFQKVVDVNLTGSFAMAQACARRMDNGGSIINVGSVLGFTTVWAPQAAYSASKAAMMGLTRDLALQWSGRRGIRVNLLAPGFFPTEMTGELSGEQVEMLTRDRIPMRRLGEIEECAAAVVFLASDAASYVNGTVLAVDGGLLVT